jgi:hypothetical protein
LAVKPVVKKVEEKMLTDPETLNLIAEKKSNAIIVFLKKSE